jgi:Flp pilus assembly protein TadG
MVRASPRERPAAAAVEFALLLPFLAFLFVIAVDFSRLFYYTLTVTNFARNGAVYLSDPYNPVKSPYSNVTQAALADAPNLSPQPTVSSANGTDENGAYVEVTVQYTFKTLTSYPGVPSETLISRTVRMNIAPQVPK